MDPIVQALLDQLVKAKDKAVNTVESYLPTLAPPTIPSNEGQGLGMSEPFMQAFEAARRGGETIKNELPLWLRSKLGV